MGSLWAHTGAIACIGLNHDHYIRQVSLYHYCLLSILPTHCTEPDGGASPRKTPPRTVIPTKKSPTMRRRKALEDAERRRSMGTGLDDTLTTAAHDNNPPDLRGWVYRFLPSKRSWALEIHGPKDGGGRSHGEAICMYNVKFLSLFYFSVFPGLGARLVLAIGLGACLVLGAKCFWSVSGKAWVDACVAKRVLLECRMITNGMCAYKEKCDYLLEYGTLRW